MAQDPKKYPSQQYKEKRHEYKNQRLLRTYPPECIKQVIVGMARETGRSVSEVTSRLLQEQVNRLSASEKQRFIEVSKSKNGY